jgi:hypothetical protein
MKEEDIDIIERYETLEIHFAYMLSIGAEILEETCNNVTILNNPELYAKLVLLSEASDPFLLQV